MRAVALSLLVGIALQVRPAAAEQPTAESIAQARALFEEGVKSYNVAHFDAALEAFQKGYMLVANPKFLINIGQCHRMMGHWKEAIFIYRRYLKERPTADNRAEVEDLIAASEEQLRRIEAAPPPKRPTEDDAVLRPTSQAAADKLGAQEQLSVRGRTTTWWRRWWVWTLAAAVVVGAGAGVTVGIVSQSGAPDPGGTAGSWKVTF